MLNKALLMAVAGKKKGPSVEGDLYSKFLFTVGDADGTPGVVEFGEDTGAYAHISGTVLPAEVQPFGRLFYFIVDSGFAVLSLPFAPYEKTGVCALVNEDTGSISYGMYGVNLGMVGDYLAESLLVWSTFDEANEALNAFLSGGAPEFPETPVLPFIGGDIGKTFTFSLYFCS